MQDEVVKDTFECVGPLRDIWSILETVLIRLDAIERKLQTSDQLQKEVVKSNLHLVQSYASVTNALQLQTEAFKKLVVTVISFRKD